MRHALNLILVIAFCASLQAVPIGNTLITDSSANCVIEVDSLGAIVWEKSGLNVPTDAERLASGNTLISEYLANRIIEVDSSGTIVWQKSGLSNPHDFERLANGNTLVACSGAGRVVELDTSGTITWERTGLSRPIDVERLGNGNTLISEYNGGRVIEINNSGIVVWQADGLNNPLDAERLANGNTLITDSGNGRVIEINSSGAIAWQITELGHVADAERLADGNTLISHSSGNRVIEVDSSGSVVWEKTGLNWSEDVERLAGITMTTFTTDTLIGAADTMYDGQDIIVDGCTLTVDGPHDFNSLQVINNGVVTHSAADSGQPDNKIHLTIAENVTIETGSSITADGKGYDSDQGRGAGMSGGGGGYGGNGGGSGGFAYGSLTEPNEPGSGGGSEGVNHGGAGGGLIRLEVGGTLTLDGALTADGQAGNPGPSGGGGGSGGSLHVIAARIAGNGLISANGGDGGGEVSGGGGGGRIAIYYDTYTFAGIVSAYGGTAAQAGGAGTIYINDSAVPLADLLIDNNLQIGALTPIACSEPLGQLKVLNRGHVDLTTDVNDLEMGEVAVTDLGKLRITGCENLTCFQMSGTNKAELDLSALKILTANQLNITESSLIQSPSAVTVDALELGTASGISHRLGEVLVVSVGSDLTMNDGAYITASVDLSISGNLTIDSNSLISADGKGHSGGEGPGGGLVGEPTYGSGAGYGGAGGDSSDGMSGGSSYGSAAEPNDLGSGGGNTNMGPSWEGGSGGGALRLNVDGSLTVAGTISANGLNGETYCGGGSGGSIYITANSLLGTGIISARGGDGDNVLAGGGSGGRIALYYDVNDFMGAVLVEGGYGFERGAAGTIYARPYARLILPHVAGKIGGRATLPVQVQLHNVELYSVDLSVSYDQNSLYVEAVEAGDIADGMMLASNPENGLIRIGLAGAESVTEDGVLIRISFEVLGMSTSPVLISFTEARINEGSVETFVQNGSVITKVSLADFDGNRLVDARDLARLLAAWLSVPGDFSWDPDCDISEPPNTIIDTVDFASLARDWLIEAP